MFELLALGMLMQQSLHGYRLKQNIDQLARFQSSMSWGTFYPLLKRLQKQGFIISQKPQAQGRERIIQRLTDKGRERFYELMASPAAALRPMRQVFRYKLVFFGELAPEQQIKVVADYVKAIAETQAQIQKVPEMLSEDALWTRTVVEHSVQEFDFELQWAESLLKNIKQGANGHT